MGDRAIVVFHSPATANRPEQISPSIYLHWNGGADSIYAFLDELDRRKVRTSGVDIGYEAARFVHIVGDLFDSSEAGGLSLGIYPPPSAITPEALEAIPADNGDNGVYVITRHDTEGNRTVRRFTFYPKAKEWTKAQVDRERNDRSVKEAAPKFAARFAELRPKVSQYS